MMFIAVICILTACLLIGIGRAKVRRARHMEPKSAPRRRANMLGWALVMAGVFFMIVGVVTW